MARRKISDAEAIVEKSRIEANRKAQLVTQRNQTVRVLVICACVGFVAYILAGQFTFVELVLEGQGWNAVLSAFSQKPVAWASLFGNLVLISWVVILRSRVRLKDSKIEDLGKRNRYLEEHINPSRASSNLHPTGNTNPEDL